MAVSPLPERLNDCMTRLMDGAAAGRSAADGALWPTCASSAIRRIFTEAGAASSRCRRCAWRGSVATVCAACHQANGLGRRLGSVNDGRGYRFPPLWGPDSFNDGAGMDQYQHIVGFVRRNMPRGVDPVHPQLSLQQAWDVAAYVISMPRPHDKAPR
jgi:thiosulfate dehydrogenase